MSSLTQARSHLSLSSLAKPFFLLRKIESISSMELQNSGTIVGRSSCRKSPATAGGALSDEQNQLAKVANVFGNSFTPLENECCGMAVAPKTFTVCSKKDCTISSKLQIIYLFHKQVRVSFLCTYTMPLWKPRLNSPLYIYSIVPFLLENSVLPFSI